MNSPADAPEHGDVHGGHARVGYLGPEGTFSEEALLASANADAVEPVGLASIYDTVMAVRAGEVDFAIVPIENSLDGSISVTLDLLAADTSAVRIVGEAVLRVSHALICAADTPLERIDTILTHPQVPGQCTRLLRGELAHARVLPASSTAEAVRAVVAAGQPGQAAIGTALAASIYGATIVREHVEDSEDNETRFVWLAPETETPAGASTAAPAPLRANGGQCKTSIVFWGAGAERPGWLVRCLDEFARREINLTKIESRPRREWLGSYMFFADLAGRAGEGTVAEAIDGLAGMCERVRVLGSYASAGAPASART
jgi:prephenate dehydratase